MTACHLDKRMQLQPWLKWQGFEHKDNCADWIKIKPENAYFENKQNSRYEPEVKFSWNRLKNLLKIIRKVRG